MKIHTVADQIVDTLQKAGVERIYGLPGDSLNGLTEALRTRSAIEWVHVRHEETAAFAAAGEAHMTGTLAVCAGSCGPGNTHLINGLFDAHRSRVPVLAIAAQIPTAEIGSGYFQETHPEVLFRECSHYCELISSPSQLPRMLEIAIRAAVGQRGVAVLVIPGDVATMPAENVATMANTPALLPVPPVSRPQDAELDALARLLNESKRVTLFCGRGCAGAHDPLMQLAEALGSPIVHALGGKESVEPNNPYDVGMTGLIGFSSGCHAVMDCDALLMLGTDFPYRQFYPTDARIAQVDIRPEQLGRRAKIELGLVGDVGATIEALLPRLQARTDRTHLDASLASYKAAREGLDELATGTPGRKPIHPQYLAKLLNDHADADAVFTCDVGTPTIWAARYLRMNGRRRLISSLVHGSMANAMTQAIGAQASNPGRQVISFSGDGGFAMLMGDLLTLRQHRLPVKVVVLNNSTLGFVQMEMQSAGQLDWGVDLENPDFAALARAAGIHGVKVDDPGDLEAAVAGFLAHPGPALLDVVSASQELPMPPHIDAKQVGGFGLFTLKAIVNGRGTELLDMARTSLLR